MKITRNRPSALTGLIAVSALLLAACGGGGSSPAASGKQPDCGFAPALVEKAQKEGAVTLYTGGHTREIAERLSVDFEAAYGIKLTVVRQADDDIVRMVDAELAAGKVNADVVAHSDASAMANLQAEDALVDAAAPNVGDIAPGLDDPNTPQLPFVTVSLGIAHNSSGDVTVPKTWDELADYQGKIAVADPSQSGTALVYFTLLKKALGDDYLTRLAQGDIVVTDSSLALAQLVLTGEAELAIPGIEPAVLAAKAGGEPLDIAFPSGPTPILVSEIAVMKDAPYASAAQLLVGYQLCQAAQEALAEQGARSVLADPPASKGVADLSGNEQVSASLPDLAESAGSTRDEFDKLFK